MTKCEICGEEISGDMSAMITHYKTHAKEAEEKKLANKENPEGIMSLGNRRIAEMINESSVAYITIRVVYIDIEPRTSKNGMFIRTVVDPVANCQFQRISYLINVPEVDRNGKYVGGSVVGKRLMPLLNEEKDLLKYQFDLQLISSSVKNSRPFVDINDVILTKIPMLTENEVKDFFPAGNKLVVHRSEN